MKFIFYLIISSQLIMLFNAYANKKIIGLDKDKSLKFEKINENKEKFKQIIWKSYQNDESYFKDKNSNKHNKGNDKNKKIIWKSYQNDENYFKNDELNNNYKNSSDYRNYYKDLDNNLVITHIDSFIPLNNFLKKGNYQTTIKWKSSFYGGVSEGTGQQNPLFLIDYGLTDESILSFYLTGADDLLYNRINGAAVPYYWQSYALSYKKKLLENQRQKLAMSYVATLEYWRIASGSEDTKSIFNQKDNSFSKEKFDNLVGAFSLPITKEFGEKVNFVFVPGITFLPEELGSKSVGSNYYGNNFYIGTGVIFNLFDNLKFLSSYTNPLGPGSNYFDGNLKYSNKAVYSYGLNWNLNQRISIEGKITNSYGSTPSTGLLTIPSDNKNLYSANLIYNPYGKDTFLEPLSERDKLISLGGLTVNNALIQDFGKSQGGLNLDSSGNLFFSYKYSLSNIFQLEFIDIGTFGDLSNPNNENVSLRDTYIDKNNINFRFGGKLMMFTPQKNDKFWSSIRTSVGRNDNTNQGYIYSEIMNTIRLNNWLAINISPKYFFSGDESFGVIGFSKYINLTNRFQIIPEMNKLLKQESEFNSTLSLRYSYAESRSIDLYYSNAVGIQDLGQNLKGEDKVGIKLNYSY